MPAASLHPLETCEIIKAPGAGAGGGKCSPSGPPWERKRVGVQPQGPGDLRSHHGSASLPTSISHDLSFCTFQGDENVLLDCDDGDSYTTEYFDQKPSKFKNNNKKKLKGQQGSSEMLIVCQDKTITQENGNKGNLNIN